MKVKTSIVLFGNKISAQRAEGKHPREVSLSSQRDQCFSREPINQHDFKFPGFTEKSNYVSHNNKVEAGDLNHMPNVMGI